MLKLLRGILKYNRYVHLTIKNFIIQKKPVTNVTISQKCVHSI